MYLPEGVLVAQGDGRESDGVVVPHADADSRRTTQVTCRTLHRLHDEQADSSQEDGNPEHPETRVRQC